MVEKKQIQVAKCQNSLDDLLAAQPAILLAALPVSSRVSAADRVVIGSARNFTRELFEGLALGLRDQEGGENTAQHEEGEDLHDVVEPWGGGRAWGCAFGSERAEDDLGDDGTDFAGSGRETVGGGAVAGREAFTRDDESSSVGA